MTASNIDKNSEPGSLFLFVVRLSLLWLICIILSACQQNEPTATQVIYSGPIMGTEYRINVIDSRDLDFTALERDIVAAMASVNQSMSNYLAESELSRFNRLAVGQTMDISVDFALVMQEAFEISEISEGAFDVTLAPAINLWGFGPNGNIDQFPSEPQIDQLKERIGFRKIQLIDRSLSKLSAGVAVDLSAIAKGYAVDKVAETLQSKGVTRYLINIGGELRASGQSLDNTAWRVGIEKPHILGGIQQIAVLEDKAIATSGDYRNYLIVDEQQFSHTIDPDTLKPVFHKLALVSVISDKASTADALATAIMSMGDERGLAFAKRQNLAVYMVIRGAEQDQYEIVMTESFQAYLQ